MTAREVADEVRHGPSKDYEPRLVGGDSIDAEQETESKTRTRGSRAICDVYRRQLPGLMTCRDP